MLAADTIYQYVGYLITTGRSPYLHAFDHKGVYFYWVNALGYLVNPKWGMWPILWLNMFGCTVLTYCISRKFVSHKAALFITLIISTGMAAGFWDGDTPDFISLAWNLLAFFLLVDYFIDDSLNRRNVLFSGVATAISFWMKPNMIIGTGTLFAGIIFCHVIKKRYRESIHAVGSFCVGLLLGSAPAIIWLCSRGAFTAMIEDYFVYNFKYVEFHPTAANRMSAFSYFISRPSIFLACLCLVYTLIRMLLKVRLGEPFIPGKMLLCGYFSFLLTITALVLPGNNYMNYVASILPSAALIYVATASEYGELYENKHAKLIILATLVLVVGLNLKSEYSLIKRFWPEIPQEQETRAYIIDNSDPDDKMAILSPYYIGYYIACERDSATKFPYIQLNHFLNAIENPQQEAAFWKEYTNLIKEALPRIILYDRSYKKIDAVAECMNEVLSDYVYAGQSTRFDFYVLPENGEIIPAFKSETPVLEVDGTINIPSEMIEAYHNGEATMDDFLELFDNAIMQGNGF